MPSKELIDAVEKELKRSACSTMDAIFLNMLRSDYEHKQWDTNSMDCVKKKYKIRDAQQRLAKWKSRGD